MTEDSSDQSQPGERTGLSGWLRRNGWNLGVLVAVVIAAATGLHRFGMLVGRTESAHERISRLEYQTDQLNQRLDEKFEAMNDRFASLLGAVEEVRQAAAHEIKPSNQSQGESAIFQEGRLTSGLDMGVNSSGGRTNWLEVSDGVMCMRYPPGQRWGAVFITVGQPTQTSRAARDFSSYRSLVIEARGVSGGEEVLIGLKDSTDPDDGSESKVLLSNLTTDWQRFEIGLSRFRTADLTRLYVPTEFVFEGPPTAICVRKIEFIR